MRLIDTQEESTPKIKGWFAAALVLCCLMLFCAIEEEQMVAAQNVNSAEEMPESQITQFLMDRVSDVFRINPGDVYLK